MDDHDGSQFHVYGRRSSIVESGGERADSLRLTLRGDWVDGHGGASSSFRPIDIVEMIRITTSLVVGWWWGRRSSKTDFAFLKGLVDGFVVDGPSHHDLALVP